MANAPKSGRPRASMTEENEMRVAMTFVNSPKMDGGHFEALKRLNSVKQLSITMLNILNVIQTKCQYRRRAINTILYTVYCVPTFGPPCITLSDEIFITAVPTNQ